MKKNIFFIDPLEKLTLKKDSTLQLILTLQEHFKNQTETYILFEENFSLINNSRFKGKLPVYACGGKWNNEKFCNEEFYCSPQAQIIELQAGDIFHMRLDPPFDKRYLRYLWMEEILEDWGVKVMNSPRGILQNNEKLLAFSREFERVETCVGRSLTMAGEFFDYLVEKKKGEFLILKPLDGYQGMGVEKIPMKTQTKENFLELFKRKSQELEGPILLQEFLPQVLGGETRVLYFRGKELGAIQKKPAAGNFLANIVQGASFEHGEITAEQRLLCDSVAKSLLKEGIEWIAFDLIGEHLSEANITCPGLLVEVSRANKKNLACQIGEHLL